MSKQGWKKRPFRDMKDRYLMTGETVEDQLASRRLEVRGVVPRTNPG